MKNSRKITGLLGLIALVMITMSFGLQKNKSTSVNTYAYLPIETSFSPVSVYDKCGEGKCGTDTKAKKEKNAEKAK